MRRFLIILAFLALPAGAGAQARILATAEVGAASGLGYQAPHILAAFDVERPIGTRWEAQGRIAWSPDRKYITHNGETAQGAVSALFWPIQRVAVEGGLEYSHLWTSQFEKSAWFPFAGAVLRDSWYGSPGRLSVRYVFPTGCQWGVSCVIQSNRLSGVEGFQEFRLWPHWRIGLRGGWWHFADQSNPLDQAAPRTWHNTGTVAMVVRYEFRAGSVDVAY